MSYKTTDALMRHLRDKGIAISGSREKRQLLNIGYYHGYKGYRFFKNSNNKLPFKSFNDVYATVRYDSELKALLWGKMMFIETAVKNIALEGILLEAKSENIQDIFEKAVSGYQNAPAKATDEQKKKAQLKKLNLQIKIQSSLTKAYAKENPIITHFYNNGNYPDVPIWALFEILTLGEFGHLLSCLTYDVRDAISKKLGLNLACDADRQLIYKYNYAFNDLRNAIAHNAVVFDARFNMRKPSNAMQQCLNEEIGLAYTNFKTIGDYVILICYYLKILQVPKTERLQFIRSFEKITESYRASVDPEVAERVIHRYLSPRMRILKNAM